MKDCERFAISLSLDFQIVESYRHSQDIGPYSQTVRGLLPDLGFGSGLVSNDPRDAVKTGNIAQQVACDSRVCAERELLLRTQFLSLVCCFDDLRGQRDAAEL